MAGTVCTEGNGFDLHNEAGGEFLSCPKQGLLGTAKGVTITLTNSVEIVYRDIVPKGLELVPNSIGIVSKRLTISIHIGL